MQRKHYINIDDVIKFAKEGIQSEKELGNHENVEILSEALNEIESSVHNPERNRVRIVEKFLWNDPYCWCLIPNYAELEEECLKLDDWKVEVEYPSSETYKVEMKEL